MEVLAVLLTTWALLLLYFFFDNRRINRGNPVVSLHLTLSGNGYWLQTFDGTMYPFGDALAHRWSEQLPSSSPRDKDPLVKFNAQGEVFTPVRFYHLGDLKEGPALNAPIVFAILTGTHNGYYLVAADGGVFTFGDAVFYGSLGRFPRDYGIRWSKSGQLLPNVKVMTKGDKSMMVSSLSTSDGRKKSSRKDDAEAPQLTS